MSKLSQLKQKAYQAGKDRNWELAISIYEKILEVEKSNPTVINELGDLCLKAGDSRTAVQHFLSAATKYRKTGLLNNSVAICKKILRHDDANMHAHWYLAENRATQDLVVEGESHALAFLQSGQRMGGEIQEIYLKRCVKLLDLYPASSKILEQLSQVFRSFDKQLEAGRAGCLKACVLFDAGDADAAHKMIDNVLVTSPELRNYPEFGTWNKRVNPDAPGAPAAPEYNSVTLGEADEEAPFATFAGQPAAGSAGENAFSDITIDVPAAAGADAKDEEGCLVIDAGDGPDLAGLIAAATRQVEQVEDGPVAQGSAHELDLAAKSPTTEEVPPAAQEPTGSVDLLSQILSEDSGSARGDASNQVDTIAAEIGSMVGGGDGDNDADRLYEMGLVYLEMGLFDKACESFETAAADDDYTLRAHEMWGVTLQREGRPDEAITVLTSGLQFAEPGSRENLGLRYHIGVANEMAQRPETAMEIYEAIQAEAPNFLDVASRLRQLAGV